MLDNPYTLPLEEIVSAVSQDDFPTEKPIGFVLDKPYYFFERE